jgi:outer membrane protein OmpA-like peptidoglycan-associated protein
MTAAHQEDGTPAVRAAALAIVLIVASGMVHAIACGGSAAPSPAPPEPERARMDDAAAVVEPAPPPAGAGTAQASSLDTDGDMVIDSVDACPGGLEDWDNFEDSDGCPDPDNDQDRLLDADDDCPNEAETYNGRDDEDGCPDPLQVVIVSDSPPRGPERISFASGSARIRSSEHDLLDEIFAVLADNPQVERVLVAGHAADDEGSSNARIRLSLRRAEAVVQYLVDDGAEAERLQAAGFGDLCPMEPGRSDQARERNRRVEFFILRTSGQCTHLDAACPAAHDAGLVPVDDCRDQPAEGDAGSAAP